jgi:hypothetical protein
MIYLYSVLTSNYILATLIFLDITDFARFEFLTAVFMNSQAILVTQPC